MDAGVLTVTQAYVPSCHSSTRCFGEASMVCSEEPRSVHQV
jgi:hypothetical protein